MGRKGRAVVDGAKAAAAEDGEDRDLLVVEIRLHADSTIARRGGCPAPRLVNCKIAIC